jgi:hypothetical protein
MKRIAASGVNLSANERQFPDWTAALNAAFQLRTARLRRLEWEVATQ